MRSAAVRRRGRIRLVVRAGRQVGLPGTVGIHGPDVGAPSAAATVERDPGSVGRPRRVSVDLVAVRQALHSVPVGGHAKICGNPPGRVLENAIRVPSGDHDGDRSSAVLLPPPSTAGRPFRRRSSRRAGRGPPASVRLAYTICVPSGDQAGSRSASVLCVSAPPPLPSAFITKMSGRPPAWNDRAKATRSPSGDQAGSISWAGFPERFVWPSRPRTFVDLGVPSRMDQNASLPLFDANPGVRGAGTAIAAVVTSRDPHSASAASTSPAALNRCWRRTFDTRPTLRGAPDHVNARVGMAGARWLSHPHPSSHLMWSGTNLGEAHLRTTLVVTWIRRWRCRDSVVAPRSPSSP